MAGEDRLVRDVPDATEPLDVVRLREDFPILRVKVRGKQLVYLDNAASAQKPQRVIDAVQRFYSTQNSNVHRGLHRLSELATEAFEGAREKVQRYINAAVTMDRFYGRPDSCRCRTTSSRTRTHGRRI